ncbi:Regulatory protein RecX [termite gut metagenome]|uniref:Regulatory protein RecX n=1 Tax=termite gut metagenome TaxID=433724 RepID=A0A5J4R7A0_9ZZZZ
MTENEALNRMAAYCSGVEHCRAEVREKLLRQELDENAIERILNRLEKEKFMDNERYTRSFINDKIRFDKWGKLKIKQALYFKQIPQEVVNRELEKIDEEEYLSLLRDILEKKKKTIRAKDAYEQKGKLMRFALGKGFEMEDIEKCM